MNKYEAGQTIRITTEVRDNANNLVDPTGILFSLRPTNPVDGAVTNYSVTRESLGRFYVEFTTWIPSGRWAYRFDCTGVVGVAAEGEYVVLGSDFEE